MKTLGPDCHVWANANPLRPGPLAARGGVGDIIALRTLTPDLDYKRLRSTDEDDEVAHDRAERIVDGISQVLGVAPTKVTCTGGGLQPRWLLDPEDGDARFEAGSPESNRATIALKRFGNLVGIIAREIWPDATVDNVFDLAHIFRVAGTRNIKPEYGSPRPVTATYPGGAALSLDSLEEALDARGIPQEQATTRKAREAHDGPVYEDMPSGARRRVDLFVDKVFDRLKDELEEGARLSPTGTDAKGRTWQRIVADAGFDGGALATDWTGLTEGDVLRRLAAIVPEEMKGATFSDGRTVSQTLNNHVSRKAKAAPPEWLPQAISEGQALAEVRRPGDEVAKVGTVVAGGSKGGDKGPQQAEIAYHELRSNYQIEMTPEGLPFAVPLEAPRLPIPLGAKGGALIGTLADQIVEKYGVVLGRDAISTAMTPFIGSTRRLTERRPLHLRVAESKEGHIVLDLGQPGNTRCVIVTPDGWSVEEEPPEGIYFQRPGHLKPLPTPATDGSPDILRDLLGLAEDDRRWRLIRGWGAVALRPRVARPVLFAVGPSGCGKTTRGKLIVNVLDPRSELGSAFGNNLGDDQTKAYGSYLVGYDNLTRASENVSDHICRLVTGDSVEKRQLHTDAGLVVLTYRRTGVVTGLAIPRVRADALERIIPLHFTAMTDEDRREEKALDAAFEEAHPRILGAVLDDAVTMLANLPATQAGKGTRMLDYYLSLLAIDPTLGAAYLEAAEGILVDAAEDDALVAAVRDWLRKRGGSEHVGPPTKMFLELDKAARISSPLGVPPNWPATAGAMSAELNAAANTLKAVGITFTNSKSNGSRVWRFTIAEEVAP
ncbi:hypothetical protein [Janibacter indicus]|uniref:hypothetical protein n=1 Tax=Janibacter indicus TaxID=857417 RepID=UPI003EC0028B